MVEYTYDTWGKLISITGSLADTIGVKNPLRYRGYYYDTETSLYYLQSRYYDPETSRFINADSLLIAGDYLQGTNMFAYCLNNPVMYSDLTGYETTESEGLAKGFAVVIGGIILYAFTSEYLTIDAAEELWLYIGSLALSADGFIDFVNGIGLLMQNGGVLEGISDKDSPPDHPDFTPPKKGNRKVKNPNGQGYGWEAKDGGVWVWTPNMHGGKGWTVQYPNGTHKHAYPGGGTRTHFLNESSLGLKIGFGLVATVILIADNATGLGMSNDPLIPVVWSAILA